MTERDAESMAEKSETHAEGSGRNPRDTVRGASRVTARREDSSPEYEQLMEAVVERFGVAVSSTTQIPAYFVNRRIRNRTYGGVGGREPRGSLLPDQPTWSKGLPCVASPPRQRWVSDAAAYTEQRIAMCCIPTSSEVGI